MANPISTVAAQLAQYVDPKSTGGAWAASGYGPQGMLEQLAQRLINKTGITNLNDMVIDTKSFPLTVTVLRYDDEYGTAWYKVLGRDVETGNPSQIEPLTPEEIRNVKAEGSWDPELGGRTTYSLDTTENITGIYNKNTGALITGQKFIDLDGWAAGEGWTSGILRFDNDNKPRVTTYGADSGDLGKILPVISIALLAVPGLGQAVGSALLPSGVSAATATAVGNAVINAGVQVASGVPVEKAIVNSAASLGVSQIVPNLSGNVFVDNAVKSVATAALTGGNVENALANSLIATGGNELLGNATFTGDKVVDSAIASAITSGVQAAATGGDVGASIIRGGISGATGQLTKEEKATESAKSGAGFIGEDVTEPTNVAGDIGKDTATISSSGNTVVVIEVDKNSNEALVIDEVGNTSVVSATDSATGESVNSGEVVTLTPDNLLTTGQATVATGIADDMASGGFVDTAPVVTAPVDTGVTDTGAVDTAQVATGGETPITNINQGITEPTNVAEPGIDPRILAQGVAGGQFGEGELLQTGSNVSSYVLPPNPQSEFGIQKNINARPDFNESSLGAKYGEINSPHYGKLISSIMINDVVDANGNPIDTPVGYYAIYDPDTKSTFYEFSLSDGTTVTSKTRPFVEQGKIFSEDKFYELKPSRQPSELNIDTGAGNGAFLGETQNLAEEPTTGITVSASKPTIDQRLLDLVEQAPDQESATNATVAYYQALDNDLSDDEALNAARTAMQAKSPPILFEDSVVEQKPTEQQVADTGLAVVGQPVDQTPVVSPTTPSVTTPTISPVVTEPVVTQPSVTQPVATQPVVTQPVVTQPVTQQPTTPDIVTTVPSTTPPVTQPVVTTPSVLTPEQIAAQELDAEVQKIMRMAVKKDPVDMRYDLNKDGRVNVIDALALKRGQATVPTVEEYQASLAQQEAARVAAEQETQRQAELQRQHEAQVAAEQARQAELERQAYEAEQARLAAEQQAKEAADAAARVAAQEAARLAAEEQARIAAEQEANRIANEQAEIARQVEAARQLEAARIATEQAEQAKLAAERAEQARIAEANRIAAEQEAMRVAAEQEIAIQEAIRQEAARAEAARAEAARVAAAQEQERTAAAAEQERLIQTTGSTTGTSTSSTAGSTTGVTGGVDTGGGTNVSQLTGTSTLTPGINVELPEPLPPPTPPPPLPPEAPTTPQEPITEPPQKPFVDKTEEDLLLEQIIKELEPKPPVSEGVPIPEPEFPEPPLALPESPTINVDDSLTVRPRVERRATRPSVSPGSRVEESAQILPIRPGLSEGGTGGIEGTTEQEQEPVWNVRSLKLRRLLGI